MSEFKMQYPTNGSSALEPERVFERRRATIIAFPQTASQTSHAAHASTSTHNLQSSRRLQLDGIPFEQLNPKTERLLGAIFTGVGVLIVLAGLL